MKKQTAVEWLFMALHIRGLLPNEEIIECYEKAKEIQKKQTIDFSWQMSNLSRKKIEKHYNEQFNNGQNENIHQNSND
jgi:hypothetical protein